MREIELTQGKIAVAYIYALCDPRDGAVRYVGKSCAPKQRLRRHLADLDATTRKRRWINSLITAGLEPKLNTHSLIGAAEGPFEYHRTVTFPRVLVCSPPAAAGSACYWEVQSADGGWIDLPLVGGDNLKVSKRHYAETARKGG